MNCASKNGDNVTGMYEDARKRGEQGKARKMGSDGVEKDEEDEGEGEGEGEGEEGKEEGKLEDNLEFKQE